MTITRTTPITDLPELLRVEEVAAWADVGKGTAYEAVRSGSLPSVRIGRLVRVPRAALERWVTGAADALTVSRTAEPR